MAVSTQSLKVRRVIIPTVTVYVVYIQLRDVYWLEVTLLAVVLTISVIRRTCLHLVNFVNGITSVPTRYGL